jgi:hypothetical protein
MMWIQKHFQQICIKRMQSSKKKSSPLAKQASSAHIDSTLSEVGPALQAL